MSFVLITLLALASVDLFRLSDLLHQLKPRDDALDTQIVFCI